jgi:hypothetical protein
VVSIASTMELSRRWTLYLAQDKHLDYNWCGSQAEIEVRMAALVDYYLAQAEQHGGRWNLDGTIWLDVYRRQRGEEGARRLLHAIQEGWIGYAANHAVLLWGILSTELAIRACTGSLSIERATGTDNKTALIMENPGLVWGAANILTECGFAYLGRGMYDLRAESYAGQRQPYPLFWWKAPNGQRLLVRWDLYADTRSWGGYAEAAELARLAGEEWDAFHLQSFGDRNTPDVYRKRVAFIRQTVQRYEAYGDRYPISSILLLGTGWDNWTTTDDYGAFIRRFNAESGGGVRIVDARYEDFFYAAEREIRERDLHIPTLEGSFGICWEEWAAHLGGPTRDFRRGERLLRQAEASHALAVVDGRAEAAVGEAIRRGWQALLRFAEHDFGGCDRATAAISAGVRAGAAAEVLSVARPLCPHLREAAGRVGTAAGRVGTAAHPYDAVAKGARFSWQGGVVSFDGERCAVASYIDKEGREWVPQRGGLALGAFVHTVYQSDGRSLAVFPEAVPSSPRARIDRLSCQRGAAGVEMRTEGERWGFRLATRWFFHTAHPWIDVTYDLAGGWSEQAQSVQFCFPLAVAQPTYRYDVPGAVLVAGPVDERGDDLPGANPSLFAAQTFVSATGGDRGAIVLTPDAHLIQFGADAVRAPGVRAEQIPAQITSMPLMNLTRNDWQLGQGGQCRWTFRYRLIFADGPYDPLRPFLEAQRFGVPPYLWVPGEAPTLPGLARLEIEFEGGPVTAFKVAEDGERLVLRLWNVLDRPVRGSVRLPRGFGRAERCDALERAQEALPVERGRAGFTAAARGILTIAFCME